MRAVLLRASIETLEPIMALVACASWSRRVHHPWPAAVARAVGGLLRIRRGIKLNFLSSLTITNPKILEERAHVRGVARAQLVLGCMALQR